VYYNRVRLLPETFYVTNFISHHYILSIPREMVMVKEGWGEKGCCEYLIYDRDAQNRHTDRLYRPHAASTQRNKKK